MCRVQINIWRSTGKGKEIRNYCTLWKICQSKSQIVWQKENRVTQVSRHCTGKTFPENLTGMNDCCQKRVKWCYCWVPPSVAASKFSGLILVSRDLTLVILEEEETWQNPQPLQPHPLPPRACAAYTQGMIWGMGLDPAHGWENLPAGPASCSVAMGCGWSCLQQRSTGLRATEFYTAGSGQWSLCSARKRSAFQLIRNGEKSH